MAKTKIVITTEGGLVTSISSTLKDTEVMVVDFDKELACDPDEVISSEEIKEFVSDDDFYDAPIVKSGITGEEQININYVQE